MPVAPAAKQGPAPVALRNNNEQRQDLMLVVPVAPKGGQGKQAYVATYANQTIKASKVSCLLSLLNKAAKSNQCQRKRKRLRRQAKELARKARVSNKDQHPFPHRLLHKLEPSRAYNRSRLSLSKPINNQNHVHFERKRESEV